MKLIIRFLIAFIISEIVAHLLIGHVSEYTRGLFSMGSFSIVLGIVEIIQKANDDNKISN